ncbi:MAG: T9SS type A sorting domain-containing protein [Bacteroidetes bacterium]|nr:T9SS type A sorting domain-containing protein [Bacteroidota bacterium]
MKNQGEYKMRTKNISSLMLTGLIILLNTLALKAADYYWVGGSGNWSDYGNHWATTSGGTIFHTAIPTLNDNVYFDANSFSATGQQVTLDNTLIYCNTMDWTGAQFNPSILGNPNQLNVYGSFKLNAAMNFSVKRINFYGASVGNTIEQAGNGLDTLYFMGSGSYLLTESIVTKSIFVYNGLFTTNNFDVTTEQFIFGGIGNTAAGDFGTSEINISNTFNSYYGNVTLNAAASNLNFINAVTSKMYLWSTGHTFNDVYFQSNSEVIGSITCNDLTADGTFYTNSSWTTVTCSDATFSGNTTLDCNFTANTVALLVPDVFFKIRQLTSTTSFTMNGTCGQPVHFQPIDFLGSGTLNVLAGTVTIDYVNLTSILATGGATFIANNSVDGGGNTGWTITSATPRTLYWIGGTGNWEDENNWSLSSGGAGGNCIPSLLDDVVFDANSFTANGEVVTITNSPATCNNMNWTGVGFNPEITPSLFPGSIILHGSLTLSPNVQWSIYELQFAGSSPASTLFSAGVNLQGVNINTNGSVTLADELTCEGLSSQKGTFNTANFDIHSKGIFANAGINPITFNFGTSTLYLSERYTLFGALLTVSGANANLVMEAFGSLAFEMLGTPAQFNNVTCYADAYIGTLICNAFDSYDVVTITDLTSIVADFRKSSNAYKITSDTVRLAQSVNQFLFDTLQVNDAFITSSSCSNTISLAKYNPFGANAQFIKATGIVQVDNAILKDIQASGGATFIANNSTDLGNNTGWTINTSPSRDLYWVGGTGTWNDNAHWSLASGGTGGECQPLKQDNVIFDANSFAQSGDTVYVHPTLGVYCNNISFASIPNATVLYSSSGNYGLNVNGSVALAPELNPYNVLIVLTSPNVGNTIATGGNQLTGLYFNGTGTWDMLDAAELSHFAGIGGTLNTNGHDINTGDVNIGGAGTLNLSTSTITTLGFYVTGGAVTINGGSANVVMTSSFLSFQPQGAHFNSVTFTGTANTQGAFSCDSLFAQGDFVNINSTITAGYAEFADDVTLSLPYVGGDVVLNNPGKLVRINNMTLTGDITSNGNSGFPIQVEGYSGLGTLTKSTGQICLDYVLLKNMLATGGAQFYAGANSVDLGGNTGWSFSSCVPPTSVVWPGDANYDLVADNTDILNIGLAYGYTGPVRAGASLAWVAQPATDWSAQFANGANLKHADTDGNGVVDTDDTTAVSLNYGLTHPFRLSAPSTSLLPAPEMYVVTNPDTASLSDTVIVEVYLGTSTLPVDSIYGIAFTLNYDTALVSPSYFNADFTGCWMGTPSVDLITFSHNNYSSGSMDFAIVRTDQSNVNGFGLLNRLGIVIVDNVGAKVTLPLTLSNVTAITASEYLLALSLASDSVLIDTTGTVGFNEIAADYNNLIVYPNPANDYVQVYGDMNGEFAVEIYNQFGVLVYSNIYNNANFRVPVTTLSQGVYFMNVKGPKGRTARKIDIIRQ